jgi:hypothetical protein
MTSLAASDLPPPPALNGEDLPPLATPPNDNAGSDQIMGEQSSIFFGLQGWFETKSTSMFKKRDKCYVVLEDTKIYVYSNDKDKKPKKVFSFQTGEIDVLDNKSAKGFSLTIVDNGRKKDQITLFGESQEYIEKWSTGILKNKTQVDYEKRRDSLNRVQNQGQLFDELWAADDDDEDAGNGTGELGSETKKKNSTFAPPEHKGYLMKQGGSFKSWKHRYMVLSHFCLSYYVSEEQYLDGKKPKGNIRVNDECEIHSREKKNLKTHPFGFILSASEGRGKKKRDYQMCSDTIDTNGVWIAKLRATVNLAKKLKKEGEAKLLVRQSRQYVEESNVSDANQPGENTEANYNEKNIAADDGNQIMKKTASGYDIQHDHESDPYYLLKRRIKKAQKLPWNRRAKSAMDYGKTFSNKKESKCQVELSFKLENLFVIKSGSSGKHASLLQTNGSDVEGAETVHSVYIVISKSAEIPNMYLSNEQVNQVEGIEYKECFKSDEVHDSFNPEFSTCFLMDVPINGDKALRADIYITHPSYGKDFNFGSAVFSMSDILQETNREMSVRIQSPLTNNTILHARYEEGHNEYNPKIAECWGLMASTFVYRGEPETRTRVLCREECWETAATFQIPLLYLKLRLSELVSDMAGVKQITQKKLRKGHRKEEEFNLERMSLTSQLEHATEKNEKSILIGKLADLEIRKRHHQDRHTTLTSGGMELEHMKQINKVVKLFSTCVDLLKRLYSSIPKNAYQRKCINLTFKPSKDKKKASLQMCPLNLHMQLYFVSKVEKDMTGGKNKREKRSRASMVVHLNNAEDDEADAIDEAKDGIKNDEYDGGKNKFFGFKTTPDTLGRTAYDIVTFGAAAAHCLKFKKGGLYSWKKKLMKLRGLNSSVYVSKYSSRNKDEEESLPEAKDQGEKSPQNSIDVDLVQWFYKGEDEAEYGPYDSNTMKQWYEAGHLVETLPIRKGLDNIPEPQRHAGLNEEYMQLIDHFEEYQEFVMLRSSIKIGRSDSVLDNGDNYYDSSKFADVGKMSDDEDDTDSEEEISEADMNEAEKQTKAINLSIAITKREDFCVCQALSALVLSFSIKLELMHEADPQYFYCQLEKVGYLFATECLVSTHKPEQGMLEDYMVAMRYLQNVKFRLNNETAVMSGESEWKQKELLTSLRGTLAAMPETSDEYAEKQELANAIVENLKASSAETTKKTWYYLDNQGEERGPFTTSEMRGWYPNYVVDETKVRRIDEDSNRYSAVVERFPNGNPFPEPSMAAVRAGKGLRSVMMERIGQDIVVTLTVPSDLFSLLPSPLQNGGLINVYPLLFQQGINEFQSIAIMQRSELCKMQNLINRQSLGDLVVYKNLLHQFKSQLGYTDEDINAHEHGIQILKESVDDEAKNPFAKHVDILASAACCVRMMKGGRGTNCKSAKDRTSMSVTLEQARLTYYNHIKAHVPIRDDKTTVKLTPEDKSVLFMANGQRRHGIRIQNAKKNVGKMKFAFNPFQRGRLPKMYRPPRVTIGATES